MLLVIHLFIAFSSLAFTTYLYFAPSKAKFNVAYGLIGGTLASGTTLVMTTHSPLLSSCMTGLIYLGIVMFGIVIAQRKLAAESQVG